MCQYLKFINFNYVVNRANYGWFINYVIDFCSVNYIKGHLTHQNLWNILFAVTHLPTASKIYGKYKFLLWSKILRKLWQIVYITLYVLSTTSLYKSNCHYKWRCPWCLHFRLSSIYKHSTQSSPSGLDKK